MTIDQHIAAAIDLGSNTFRLLVANRTAEKLEVLEKELVTVRLGYGLTQSQNLHEQAMLKGLAVLHTFRKILDRYRPQNIRICGTEALRQAENSKLFLQRAEEILRHKIDIITGEDEAHLSLVGVSAGWQQSLSGKILLVDVGGGSTEFILTETMSGQTQLTSTGMGVVSLTEKYLATAQTDIEGLDETLAVEIENGLKILDLYDMPIGINIIGSGGTATSMAALDLALTSYNETLVHGHVLTVDAMEELWSRLISLPPEKRNEIPCLGDGRGEILPAGVRIFMMLLKFLQANEMRVSDSGLLEGILLSSFQDTPLAD